MQRRNCYAPTVTALEARLVLSHSFPARGLSVIASGLQPHMQVINARHQSVSAEVGQAFDSFASDYDQARAIYFAAIQNVTDSNVAMASFNAFKTYTRDRVSLLSQQVISSFLQSPQANARGRGKPNALKQLIEMKLIGPQNTPTDGSLSNELITAIPQPGASAATDSLFALAQDNAIETARVAILNGVSILRNGDFGNNTPGVHPSHK